jgi:hypothetical protein
MFCAPLILGGPHSPACDCASCRSDRKRADAWVDELVARMREERAKRQLGQALSDLLCGET